MLAGGRGRGREDEDLISGSSNTNRTIIAIGGGAIERRRAHTCLIERGRERGYDILIGGGGGGGTFIFSKKDRKRVGNKGFEYKAFYLVRSRRVFMS